MELLLMRHADAVSGTGDDFVRALSGKGRKQAEKMGNWLKRLDLFPLFMVSSPYPRAMETAAIVQGILGKDSALRKDERLSPGMTTDAGSALVHEFGAPGRRLLLVGHSPDLGRLCSHLLGARGSAVAMTKAAVACLEAENAGAGGSVLQWLITPKL